MSGQILSRVVAWAAGRDDIRALVLTGSRARDDAFVDDFSDYDLEVFTTRIERYDTDFSWIDEIAPVWVYLALPLPTDERYRMRLVVFEGGEKVDFGFAPTAVLDEMAASGLNELYERGYRVLLDKAGRTADLPTASGAAPVHDPPSEDEFRALCQEFWFEAFHIPGLLHRSDLWVVKSRDWTMKQLLRRMIEWHAVASHGPAHDTWHNGTKMGRWTSSDVWAELGNAFGHFDRADSWRALVATTTLFRTLAHETAAMLGFSYPEKVDAAIGDYLDRRRAAEDV